VSLFSRPHPWSAWPKSVLAACLLATVAINVQVQAKETVASLDVVALSALPREAHKTHQLILTGGPFPYEKDGTVFGNRERILPKHPRGYYREYTVPTPGAKNRGARRLVCGGKPPSTPDVCYYTGDHYSSFKRVAQ
jgi:ribonuclease T1